MSSQKVENNFPDSHFGSSFALSLVAIALLTIVLPLITPASKVVPSNPNTPNPIKLIK